MPNTPVDWTEVETVLLDMDGTLLDLHYDNHFWLSYLPDYYARLHALEPAHTRILLTEKFRARQGELAFYCIDHWSRELNLDILPLKSHISERIAYLPGALQLLEMFARCNIERVLVTNAHRKTLELKDDLVGICSHMEASYASHDFGIPKEDPDFWSALAKAHHFDPAKTVLIDDNTAVLDSAAKFGIATCVLPLRPDTTLPVREDSHRLPIVDSTSDTAMPTQLVSIAALSELLD